MPGVPGLASTPKRAWREQPVCTQWKKKKKQANNVTVNDLSNIWKIHYYFINNLLQSLVYSTYLHKAQENQDFPLL